MGLLWRIMKCCIFRLKLFFAFPFLFQVTEKLTGHVTLRNLSDQFGYLIRSLVFLLSTAVFVFETRAPGMVVTISNLICLLTGLKRISGDISRNGYTCIMFLIGFKGTKSVGDVFFEFYLPFSVVLLIEKYLGLLDFLSFAQSAVVKYMFTFERSYFLHRYQRAQFLITYLDSVECDISLG